MIRLFVFFVSPLERPSKKKDAISSVAIINELNYLKIHFSTQNPKTEIFYSALVLISS